MPRQNVLFLLLLFALVFILSAQRGFASPVEETLARLAHYEAVLNETGIYGIASNYNPFSASSQSGDLETASGELYSPESWTAAIRTDLRDQFGGINFGRNYRPAYALVECGDKRVIVRINDVGPLKPGRIIDFNDRTMRYFDSTFQVGLVRDVIVTPLPGDDWVVGPIARDVQIAMIDPPDDKQINAAGPSRVGPTIDSILVESPDAVSLR